MSDDTPPIDPDEPILRRIFIGPGFFDPTKAPPVQAGAFRPNRHDTDGISFFRERLYSAFQVVSDTGRPADYKVARMLVRELLALGLSLDLKQEVDDPPGHVVVPEINSVDYNGLDRQKINKIKALNKSLADLANKPGATFQPHIGTPSIQ